MAKEFQQIEWGPLVEDECRRVVRAAVLEDLDRGQDWTTLALVDMETPGQAAIVARHAGTIAGMRAVRVVIDEIDRDVRLSGAIEDGRAVSAGTILGMLEGPARSLLTMERLILNLVGHLSGIATLTARFVRAIAGTKARIYDTRKTTPGWRRMEKYAVGRGGGHNHRTGLFDAILIKDNHLVLGQSTATRYSAADAVRRARELIDVTFPANDPRRDMIVEIEVESLEQLREVLPKKPDIVLLDNMSSEQLKSAVELRNDMAPQVELEASGGVTLDTVAAIAATGVDRISAGALTHSAISFDVALDWAAK
jgi:nicotinate-nucleotide pyrophosphorylase (carboxylating)